MPRFVYEAKQTPTQTVKGSVTAENQRLAIDQISRLGYYIVSVVEEKDLARSAGGDHSTAPGFFFKRVSLKELTNFTRQLADLLDSGLTIVKALDILDNQSVNKRFKAAIQDIREFCVSGSTLSAALTRHPEVFTNLFVVMVRAGETGGSLEAVLRRLSNFNEKQLEIQTRVRTALAYPLLMTTVGALTILVLLTFVIPRMMGIFEDMGHSLPLPTQILLFISGALTRYWWLCGMLAAGVFTVAFNAYRTPQGRRWIDGARMKLPVFGALSKKIEIARFTHTLATLLENGVSVLEALKVATDTLENILIKNELETAYSAVKSGQSLSASLSGSKVVPGVVIQMIAVGEESGRLEKTLLKVAESFERESDESIKIMMSLLEPVLILTLGLIVGFIVVSILLPIFEISLLAG